ncbi:MAG: extracellular solute-binding protein, partial [Anaerolineales bacterium]|nr:extracellular solute-binding protein [Anaerolineales bacterium]
MNIFISRDKTWQSHGLNPKALSLTTFDEEIYGLPFTLSTPVIIYNADLVRQAGDDPDDLPTSWSGIFKLARKINALGNEIHGLNYVWDLTGNWMFQALIFSKGGEMMYSDGTTLGFTGPAGQFACQLIDRMVKEAQMPNLTEMQSIDMMAGGQLGILASSCADL